MTAFFDRLAAFRESGVNALEWFSILDGNTALDCAVRAGKLYTLDLEPIGHSVPMGRPPPRHSNCRCILLPNRFPDGPPLDGGPRLDSFVQFLDRRSEVQLEALLGKSHARLYRAGQITLADLIGQLVTQGI